jgi:hypothetical protein
LQWIARVEPARTAAVLDAQRHTTSLKSPRSSARVVAVRRLLGATGIVLACVAGAAGTARAQDAEPAAAAVASDDAPTDAAAGRFAGDGAPTDAAAGRFAIVPFGYLRLQAAVVQNDPDVAFVGRADGFELQNARVGVAGTIGERVGFVLSIDGAVDERDRKNDPDGTLRVGLRDAYVDLALAPTLDLTAGRFEVWFDPESPIADTARPFIDDALESRGVRPTEGYEAAGLPPGRSLGLALRRPPGEPRGGVALGGEVAAQNGADEFSSNNDNDRVALSAAGLARFTAGWALVGVRYNPRSEGELPFRQDETDLQGSAGAGVAFGPVRVALGAIAQRTTFATTGGPAENAYGGHAQILVAIPTRWPLEVGYRAALLDPSSLVLTDRVVEHTIGASLDLPPTPVRVQLGAVHVVEQADRQLANDRIEALLQVAR